MNVTEQLIRALERIERWFGEFPETGEFWDEAKTRPMSYSACHGSNGERDYMRAVARGALAAYRAQPAQASQEPTDADIEAAFKKAGGRWNGSAWVIEDADLHPFVRSVASPQPARAPLTDEQIHDLSSQWVYIRGGMESSQYAELREFARAIEAARGITGTEGGE